MTNEELIAGLGHIAHMMERNGLSYHQHVAEDAIKALEQQPCEDCISRRATIDAIYKKHVGGKDAIENAPINDLYACGLEEAVDAVENMPSVTLQIEPCEDCISRQKVLDCFEQTNTRQGAKYAIETLPSVTPTSEDIKEAYIKGYDYGVKDWFKSKTQPCEDCISREHAKQFLYYEIEHLHDDSLYDCFARIIDDMYNELPSVKPTYTDEEIDKAQAVEQAYVDKMVELAVEESRKKWLNSFDTSSATKCFEAVNLLKQRLEEEE